MIDHQYFIANLALTGWKRSAADLTVLVQRLDSAVKGF
jgi:hypothetical protein